MSKLEARHETPKARVQGTREDAPNMGYSTVLQPSFRARSQSEKSFATTDLCAVLKAAEAVQVAPAATVPEMIWNFNGTLIFCRMFSFEIPIKR